MTDPYAALEWLAQAHSAPDHALALLLRHGRAALETGLQWDAVQVPETTGLLVLDRVRGPAFRDAGRRAVLFLVPCTGGWAARNTAYLTDGVMVCTPAPDLRAPDPDGPPGLYWLTPPDGSGRLVDPVALFEALATAPAEAGTEWCALCGQPGPTTHIHQPGLSGPGRTAPAHESCVTAGIVHGRLHRR